MEGIEAKEYLNSLSTGELKKALEIYREMYTAHYKVKIPIYQEKARMYKELTCIVEAILKKRY